MHWIDGGPEPDGVSAIRLNYTGNWVRHYRDSIGKVPNDSRWRDFKDALKGALNGICGYCERTRPGEVDHFRPKSKFPDRVYLWSNWIFACHDCNHTKGSKWPTGGYVDPCTRSRGAQPENHFGFDVTTGEVLPKLGLSANRRSKASNMIDDLQLNGEYHKRARQAWLMALSGTLVESCVYGVPTDFIKRIGARNKQWSSLTRAFFEANGYTGGW